ncbi:hypothetical protein [Otariodibacter oris]|uniref:Uncharacterized protein n=1 Tax=Otariodibacter oris TaxID=1032623 RepID=A0A420XEX3_9PAST|nr:hypothetical protein [Otariodibacter oris]QGM81480.1 hypothetical protein A6A10_08700 [Otariodibacter oris]RKR71083.1 hypothetical protein DES31_1660 [Otariodibacter oris]
MASKTIKQAEQKAITYIEDVLPKKELASFKKVKSSLWVAQSILEVMAQSDIQEVDIHALQNAIRGVAEMVLDSVAQLEEL